MADEPASPWDIAPEHRRDTEARKLRYYLRDRAGLPITSAEQTHLDRWLWEMDNTPDGPMVLTYDASDGWQYVPREPRDGIGFLRIG